MRRLLALTLVLGLACAGGKDGPDDPSDDTAASDDTACEADFDGDGVPDCEQSPGGAVLLYNGNGGGAYDIYEETLQALFQDAGYTADISATLPADAAETYGLLLVLSPTGGFPDAAPARGILARGGNVVVATEHGGYGDHEGATAWMAALGGSLRSISASNGGTQQLSVNSAPPLTDGVSALELFYCADVDPGTGVVVGTREDGEPGVVAEALGQGHLVLVPDGSFFGYVLESADNADFLLNLAP